MTSTNIYPYVYKLVQESTGHYYYGVRFANTVPAAEDPYMGSGTHPKLEEPDFEKQIVAEFFDKSSAQEFELLLIRESSNDPLCLNKCAFPHYTMCGVEPWNKGKTGLQKWEPGRYEKIYTPETRRKMSLAKKGKDPWNKGKTCAPRTDEAKTKTSASLTGLKRPMCSCVLCGLEVSGHSLWRHYKHKHNSHQN